MERIHELLAAVLTLGLGLYGYGVAVTFGYLNPGWGPVVVTQSGLMVVGGLLGWLVALVVLWSRFQSSAGLLTSRDRLTICLLAPILTLVSTMGATWLSAGVVTLPRAGWTVVGLVVLSFQFYLGTLTPARLRRRILALEPGVVFVLILAVQIVDRSTVDPVSFLAVSIGGVLVLVLVGGPLYLLGARVGDGTALARESSVG